MERETVEGILQQLAEMERRLAALERGRSVDGAPGDRESGAPACGPCSFGGGPGDGQRFEEKRVVDLIVTLVEERLARLLSRRAGNERERETHPGCGCRECGERHHRRHGAS